MTGGFPTPLSINQINVVLFILNLANMRYTYGHFPETTTLQI